MARAHRMVGAMNFHDECKKLLREYEMDAIPVINDCVKDAADYAVKLIRRDSKKRTGLYAKDWTKKMVRTAGFGASYVIHNRKHYRVAHLLEKDHTFSNQYGQTGYWKGDHVIADAEEITFAYLTDEVAKRLG